MTRLNRLPRRSLALAAGLALVAVACGSSGSPAGSSGSATPPAPLQQTFVVIGDAASAPVEDAIPVGESWPQWFFRTALSRDAVFVNLATEVASAHLALSVELPLALRLHPTVAGVFVGLADVAESGPVDRFSQSLQEMITELHAAGAHTVLVATLPDEVRGVSSYNRAIVSVVHAEGAVLVDLTPLKVTFVPNRTDFTPVPDRASQHAIADAFTAAYRAQARPSP